MDGDDFVRDLCLWSHSVTLVRIPFSALNMADHFLIGRWEFDSAVNGGYHKGIGRGRGRGR